MQKPFGPFVEDTNTGVISPASGKSFSSVAAMLYGDVVLGDSISTNTGEMAWFDYMCAFSMGKLQFVSNDSIGAQTIEQLMPILTGTVLPRKPRRVHLMWGTNNWAIEGATAIFAQYDIALAAIRATGADIIIYAIPPNTGNLSLFYTGNELLARYCELNRVPFINIWTNSVNPTTGDWAAGLSGDGIHPVVTHHGALGATAWSLFPKHLCNTTISAALCATEGICVDPFMAIAPIPFGAGSAQATGVVIPGSEGVLGNWASVQLENATAVVQASFKHNYGATYAKDGDEFLMAMRVRVRDVVGTGSWRWQVRNAPGAGSAWSKGPQYLTRGSAHSMGDFLFTSRNKLSGNPNQSSNPCRVELWIDAGGGTLTGKWEIAQLLALNLTTYGLSGL